MIGFGDNATRSRWAVLTILCAGLLLVAMGATILNVALPSLINDLRPDAIQQLWIIDVYALVLGGLLIPAGAIGHRWGRRLLFRIGFGLFGVASVLAATAQGPNQLIAGRVLLGVGGAMVMPSTLSLIRQVFTDRQERAVAIAIWAAVAGVGVAVGPVVGGLLVQSYGWAAAFWVNVPIVVVIIIAGLIILPESRTHGAKPLDRLDFRPFDNRAFLAGAVSTLAAMMGIGAALFLLSLWLQYVQELSPLQAGARMLPAAIAIAVAALCTARLVRRLGVRAVLGIGLGMLTLGFVALALLPLTYPVVAVALAAFGFGAGLAITASAAVMVSAAPPERTGSAAAVLETCYALGIGLGVALLGSIAAAVYRIGMRDLRPIEPTGSRVDESIGDAHRVASQLPELIGGPIMEVAQLAYVDALTLASAVAAVLVTAATAIALWLIPRDFRADTQH